MPAFFFSLSLRPINAWRRYQTVLRDAFLAGSNASGRRRQAEDLLEQFRAIHANASLFARVRRRLSCPCFF
jgi:hypothetical protein